MTSSLNMACCFFHINLVDTWQILFRKELAIVLKWNHVRGIKKVAGVALTPRRASRWLYNQWINVCDIPTFYLIFPSFSSLCLSDLPQHMSRINSLLLKEGPPQQSLDFSCDTLFVFVFVFVNAAEGGSTTTMYGCLSFAEPFFKIVKPVFHWTIGHTY